MRYSRQVSSPRVASWIHDVINVFIDALTAEKALLDRGNTSWRFYDQRLEHVRPAASYLSHNGQHILRDLIFEQPEVATWLRRHDETRNRLEAAATEAYAIIVGHPGFRTRVEDARKAYLVDHPHARPTGAYAPERHPDLVAEYVINRVSQLPQHYTDSEFWSLHGADLRSAAPPVPNLDRVRSEMAESDGDAVSWFARLSLDLCKKFDVPAAPSGSFDY